MKNYQKLILVGVSIIVILAFVYYPKPKVTPLAEVPLVVPVVESLLKDGRQCYAYSHEANKLEPYAVTEFLDLTISNNVVNGTKKGNQSGPDMTNGYAGTISGTVDGDMINAIFSYVVEGSSGKEKEIYKMRADEIGLEKLRYQLVDKNGVQVPDMTTEFKTMLYARVGCEASN